MKIDQMRIVQIVRIGVMVAVLLVLATLVGACNDQSTAPEPVSTPVTIVVESGVTVLSQAASPPNEQSGAAAETAPAGELGSMAATAPDPVAGATPEDAAPASPTDPDILEIGAEVQARGMLRLYAFADPAAPTLAEYAAGERFIILGPPGDIVTYPVELSGVRWYRVRADDDLVGWVMADGIELMTVID